MKIAEVSTSHGHGSEEDDSNLLKKVITFFRIVRNRNANQNTAKNKLAIHNG